MKVANTSMIKHDEMLIAETDVSSRSNTRFAERVLAETLEEIPLQRRVATTERLNSIFVKWQYEHGIYPPRPSGLIQALVTIGFSPEGPSQVKFKEYTARETFENVSAIKPWECDDYAKNATDLFCKLLLENYEPLMKYLVDEESPRFDHVFSVAILMALQFNLTIASPAFLEWSYRLVEMRMKIQRSLIDRSKDLVRREQNRLTARAEQGRMQTEKMMQKVRDCLNELSQSEGRPSKPSQKVIARMLGIEQPHVSRLLEAIKKEDQEAVRLTQLET